jgi:hypothetical protein
MRQLIYIIAAPGQGVVAMELGLTPRERRDWARCGARILHAYLQLPDDFLVSDGELKVDMVRDPTADEREAVVDATEG